LLTILIEGRGSRDQHTAHCTFFYFV